MGLNDILRWPEPKPSPKGILEESERMKRELEEEILQNPENINNLDIETLREHLQVEKDGSLSLFKKPLAYWILHFDIPNLFPNNLSEEIEQNFQKKNLLWDILGVWVEQASRIQQGILLKYIRDDDEIIQTQISTVISLYKNLEQQFFMLNTEEFNEKIREIFAAMYVAEDQEEIIGNDDVQTVEDAFFSSSSTNESQFLQIMNALRYGGWSGNSTWVQNVIEQRLLQKEDFQDVREIISRIPEFIDLLEESDYKSLRNILGKEISSVLITNYLKIKHTITKRLQEQEWGASEEDIEKAIYAGIQESLSLLLQKSLIYQKISHMSHRGNSEYSLTWMYADMVGLGENKWFLNDAFNVSDENVDWIIEWWVSLGIGLLTLWAGTLAMVWTRALISWVWLTSRLARSGKILNFIWWSALDGFSFYEWATIFSNALYKEDWHDIFDGTADIKEIWKSMLFMGILNGVMRWAWVLKNKPFIQNIESKVWTSLSPKTSKLILSASWLGLSTGAIMWISGTIEELFGEWWEPSWKEYFHLLALLGAFHRIQNFSIKRDSPSFSWNLVPA